MCPVLTEALRLLSAYAGSDLLYVFSSNAWPFEPEAAYTKFSAYALLEQGVISRPL
jgi:hypothetical protein